MSNLSKGKCLDLRYFHALFFFLKIPSKSDFHALIIPLMYDSVILEAVECPSFIDSLDVEANVTDITVGITVAVRCRGNRQFENGLSHVTVRCSSSGTWEPTIPECTGM